MNNSSQLLFDDFQEELLPSTDWKWIFADYPRDDEIFEKDGEQGGIRLYY